MARHSFGTPEQERSINGRDVRTVTAAEMDTLLDSSTVAVYHTFPSGLVQVWFHGQQDYVVYQMMNL
jgi:hypothetical protein